MTFQQTIDRAASEHWAEPWGRLTYREKCAIAAAWYLDNPHDAGEITAAWPFSTVLEFISTADYEHAGYMFALCVIVSVEHLLIEEWAKAQDRAIEQDDKRRADLDEESLPIG